MQQGETAYKVVKGRPKRVRTVRIKRIIFVYIFNFLTLKLFWSIFTHLLFIGCVCRINHSMSVTQ